jgi:Asp-tRNA(Asn)/Glu-tRNA(Gln) amidotransferase A subunit family amidase
MARTVEDAGLLLDAIRQPRSPRDRNGSPRDTSTGYTVGTPDRFFLERTDPEMLSTYREAVSRMARSGSQIREVRLPPLFEVGVDAGYVVMRVEIAAFHQHWFSAHAGDYGPKLSSLIESGLRIPSVSYIRAQQVRHAAALELRQLFREIDVLATPAALGGAPAGLSFTGDPIFNAPFTIFGVPALTVPVGSTGEGLPLGLQLAADYYHDVPLLDIGKAVEAQTAGGVR